MILAENDIEIPEYLWHRTDIINKGLYTVAII